MLDETNISHLIHRSQCQTIYDAQACTHAEGRRIFVAMKAVPGLGRTSGVIASWRDQKSERKKANEEHYCKA